jgi:UDP-2,3-diacylglucosamine hydrolase
MTSSPIFFIADLHLTPEHPSTVQLFHRFIQQHAPQAQALYILGDLFETWVGDDDLTHPFNQEISASLKALSTQNVEIFFIAGNRDFLIGPRFAQATGLTCLPDPSIITLFGTPTLLAHGDSFCTDDLAYQNFRQQVRTAAWQNTFLAQSLSQRHAIAASIRARSEHAKSAKSMASMDVNHATIEAALTAAAHHSSSIKRIIHGHTHQPARHEYQYADDVVERWVLPDWYEQAGKCNAGYLICSEAGCHLAKLS